MAIPGVPWNGMPSGCGGHSVDPTVDGKTAVKAALSEGQVSMLGLLGWQAASMWGGVARLLDEWGVSSKLQIGDSSDTLRWPTGHDFSPEPFLWAIKCATEAQLCSPKELPQGAGITMRKRHPGTAFGISF